MRLFEVLRFRKLSVASNYERAAMCNLLVNIRGALGAVIKFH